jgi:uncharacterized protein with HEPN domain
MKGELTDRIRIQHILDAIAETENYLTNANFEDFLSNSEKRFATIKQIEIVGEASNHLTNELKHQYSEIEWLQINGFRNISVHEYFGINLRIVWDIANNDLPVLKLKFIEVLKKL